ncbi:hypothetical protein [Psychrobacter namhaensis]|uniref:hypothetical protein n=1 Tax=Psychrobacter namhaensis TaxID=292734 RepID=UPI0018E00997|nr:hypothetical protein [Psychrobacter namhaensis]
MDIANNLLASLDKNKIMVYSDNRLSPHYDDANECNLDAISTIYLNYFYLNDAKGDDKSDDYD